MHLTYQRGRAMNAPDRLVLSNEIDVTPEMADAGGREIMCWAFDLVSGDSRLSGEAAKAVFYQMLKHRPEWLRGCGAP